MYTIWSRREVGRNPVPKLASTESPCRDRGGPQEPAARIPGHSEPRTLTQAVRNFVLVKLCLDGRIVRTSELRRGGQSGYRTAGFRTPAPRSSMHSPQNRQSRVDDAAWAGLL